MYLLNKIVGGCLNPLVIGLGLVLLGGIFVGLKRRRMGLGFWTGALVWLWLWSTPMMYRWIGGALENEWPIVKAEEAPKADAIVLLGGGMGSNTNVYPYAEMWGGADRVWHAARLYKAGKAPIVIPTGCGERDSAVPLLRDLGVPKSAIMVEDAARNTEENARFVERMLKTSHAEAQRRGEGEGDLFGHKGQEKQEIGRGKNGRVERVDRVEGDGKNSRVEEGGVNSRVERVERVDGEGVDSRVDGEGKKQRVLLVTSAWHMRRSVLMYRKYAPSLEIIPAAADYEATVITGRPFAFKDIWPDANMLFANSYIFKEYLGYWGYRLVRSD